MLNNAKFIAASVICMLFLPVLSPANDSPARIGTGEIMLFKNENIRMLQEELEISTNKIRVRYRFLNESDQDIKTTVAFPLPDEEAKTETYDSEGFPANPKFHSFKSWTDGKPVTTKRMRKAIIAGKDITDRLRKIGLTDKQIFETFGINKHGEQELTDKQYKVIENINKKTTQNRFGSWTVSETIYWDQLFPKGKEIEVIHEFTPKYGQVYQNFNGKEFNNPLPKTLNSNYTDKSNNEACVDDKTLKSVKRKATEKLRKSPNSSVMIYLQNVEYILGTGRNWKGPIGSFTLRVIKESPDQLVSLCFPSKPKKINSKILEFSQTGYRPQGKLEVYFISIGNID